MNAYDECKIFGPREDFELPEHLPEDVLDSSIIGLWCVSRGEHPIAEAPWLTDYYMVAVTKTGRSVYFSWPLSDFTDFENSVAGLFGSD